MAKGVDGEGGGAPLPSFLLDTICTSDSGSRTQSYQGVGKPRSAPPMSRRKPDYGAVYGVAAKALAYGGKRMSASRIEWDISCRCLWPPTVDLSSSTYGPKGENLMLWVEMTVRCRRCANCLKVRSWEWAERARQELAYWPRSYLGTLTLSPEEQLRARYETHQRLKSESVRIDDLPADQQWMERVSTIGSWITRYIKRVRQEMGTPSRYLLVCEAHKSGEPHFHMLFHECERFQTEAWETYHVLKSQWPHGFSDFGGIDFGDLRSSRYVTKYLNKSALARVRASARYGRLSTEVSSVADAPPAKRGQTGEPGVDC